MGRCPELLPIKVLSVMLRLSCHGSETVAIARTISGDVVVLKVALVLPNPEAPLLMSEPFPETTLLFIVTFVLPATATRPLPCPELFQLDELPEALRVELCPTSVRPLSFSELTPTMLLFRSVEFAVPTVSTRPLLSSELSPST